MNTIVNTNVSALNAHRAILSVGGRQARSAERLSSGMRINRAADDAAGLAISEKMRNQIRGLDQATRNSQDGISLIQTAEGALEEIHRILERAREITNQASNDVYTQEDRRLVAAEINQIIAEIDNIAQNTQFNELNILTGTGDDPIASTMDSSTGFDPARASMIRSVIGNLTVQTNAAASQTATGATRYAAALELRDAINQALDEAAGTLTNEALEAVVEAIDALEGSGTVAAGAFNDDIIGAVHAALSTANFEWAGDVYEPIRLQVQSGANPGQRTEIAIERMTVSGLGLGEFVERFNLWTQDEVGTTIGLHADGHLYFEDEAEEMLTGTRAVTAAGRALSTMMSGLDSAINIVSTQRANLGAIQNRLEHTINNLRVASENLSAANARIRDTDMAREMMAYTQANVLQQAGMSMLAQANMQPQNILQLLN